MSQQPNDQLYQMHVPELVTENAATLADLLGIEADLRFVIQCCEHLRQYLPLDKGEGDDSVLAYALWSAALLAYNRCFNTGVRGHLTEDTLSRLPLEGDVIEYHRYLRDMRDKHIAHSVNPFETVRVGAMLTAPELPDHKVEGIAKLRVSHVSMVDEDIQQFAGFVAHLLQEVIGQAQRQTAVVQAEAEAMDIDQLYARPPMTITAPEPQHARKNRRSLDALRRANTEDATSAVSGSKG